MPLRSGTSSALPRAAGGTRRSDASRSAALTATRQTSTSRSSSSATATGSRRSPARRLRTSIPRSRSASALVPPLRKMTSSPRRASSPPTSPPTPPAPSTATRRDPSSIADPMMTVCPAAARPSPPPQRAEEGEDVGGERLRLFERGEMPAPLHHRPAVDVVAGLGEAARRPGDLPGEGGVAGGHPHPVLVGDPPASVEAVEVEPERRVDRGRQPVEHHVRQERVPSDARLLMAVAAGL